MDEGYSRQARQFFVDILTYSKKINAVCGEKTRPDGIYWLRIQVLKPQEVWRNESNRHCKKN